MKPHMQYIAQTLSKKQAVKEAANEKIAYEKYTKLVSNAQKNGFPIHLILKELETEKEKVLNDERDGDFLFQQGVSNAQVACVSAIELIMLELKGE